MSNEQALTITVETDDGPITLATIDELKALLVGEQARLESLEGKVKELEVGLQDRLADVGIHLAYGLTAPPSSPELAARLAEARALLQEYRTLDTELDHLRSKTGFLKRLGDWGARHKAGDELSSTRERLHALGVAIATLATADDLSAIPTVHAAFAQRAELEPGLPPLRTEAAGAADRVRELEDEIEHREGAVGKVGFDPYYTVARLATSGPAPLEAPLELRSGEVVHFTARATLVRMRRHTRFVGTSQGVSIPLGHGFRYRIGAFEGQPIATDVQNRIDDGCLVVTTQRLAFVGMLRSVLVPLPKIVSIDPRKDGMAVFREGRETPDIFLMSNGPEVYFHVQWVQHQISPGTPG